MAESQGQQLRLFDNDGAMIHISEKGKLLVDPDTGEEVYLQAVNKPYYGERHFWKIFLLDFLAVLGIIESKQLDVVIYIMEHTSPYNNQFIGTYRKIATELGISKTTVQTIFTKLLGCNFLTKTDTRGVYQINPSVMMQGSQAKQRGLLIKYTESHHPLVMAEAAEMGALALEEADTVEIEGEVIDDA